MNRAMAAEAAARARVEVAARGLNATVIQDYYAIVARNASLRIRRRSVAEAERFLDITQKQERGGEVAHADVVKAQIDLPQRRRDLIGSAAGHRKGEDRAGSFDFSRFQRGLLGGRRFARTRRCFRRYRSAGAGEHPPVRILRLRQASIKEAGYEAPIARYGYLPSLGLDLFYGIDANQFAVTSHDTQDTGRSTLPNYEVTSRQNLGYVAQATLNIPVWNWGATRSKVKQAELKRDQAQLDLNAGAKDAARQCGRGLRGGRGRAGAVRFAAGVGDLATESLRLTVLRYQAGEATALEVVDAQNTLTQARSV